MAMRVALDTNILAYAEGVGDDAHCNAAIALVEQLPAEGVDVVDAHRISDEFCAHITAELQHFPVN